MLIISTDTYPTDGESYAHGSTTETEVLVEYDDIYKAIHEHVLMMDKDTSIKDNIVIDEEFFYDFSLGKYISGENIKEFARLLDIELLEDNYDFNKHFRIVENWLDDALNRDISKKITISKQT